MIISYNNLEGESITPGMKLMIPDGVGPEPEPEVVQPSYYVAAPSYSAPSRVSHGGSTYNRFPYGYCTWYVASRRNIPWNGNAWQWYGNGAASGNGVGRTPVPGAVMVTWESPVGHVAYVESVNGNTFTISEMNYRGWGVVSSRTITVGSVPLIGFVY
jgi:surface antigen